MAQKPTREQFKTQIAEAAKRVCAGTNIPWQLPAAQACLESGYGQSIPTDINTGQYSYNIFGIKGVGPAGSVLCWTAEFYPEAKARELVASGAARPTTVRQGGLVKVYVKDRFRAYRSFDESLQGYMKLMSTTRYKRVSECGGDPVAAAEAVKACGYATDPRYVQKVVDIMRREGWI